MEDILKVKMLDGLRYYRDEAKQMLAMANNLGATHDATRLERQINNINNRIRDWDSESQQMH